MPEFASTTRLPAVTSARLSAELTREAIAFARSLVRIEDEQLRLTNLCDHAVNQSIPALWACALRMTPNGSLSQLCAPAARSGSGALGPTPQVLQALGLEHQELLLSEAGPHVLNARGGASGDLVVCALGSSPDSVDLFLIELHQDAESAEWTPLFALLAESWANATEFWQSRQVLAVNAAMQRELEMAQRLQDSLIERNPEVGNLDVAIGYHPSRWVGGDYVDVIQMPDGRLLTIVADVCGKGFQAALVASSLHALAHVLVQVCDDLSGFASHMHAYVTRYLPIDSFVTMVCTALNADTHEVECLNLGHPPPLIVREDGVAEPLQYARNSALGMLTCTPQSETYAMSANDVLLLYTDGMTELRSSSRESGVFEVPDTALLAGALGSSVDIIRLMAGADIYAIRDRVSQSLRSQLDQATASDDAAFLLARFIGGERSSRKSSPPRPRTVGHRLPGDHFGGVGARPHFF
jgi:serine phosphatase RsbU (regulator of sigma subunit)